jgi:hypothetical protein
MTLFNVVDEEHANAAPFGVFALGHDVFDVSIRESLKLPICASHQSRVSCPQSRLCDVTLCIECGAMDVVWRGCLISLVVEHLLCKQKAGGSIPP